jgi:urease accessory protein
MLIAAPAHPTHTMGLVGELNERLRAEPEVLGAASLLPDGVGITVRLLADRAPALHTALLAQWRAARRILLGRDALPGRV